MPQHPSIAVTVRIHNTIVLQIFLLGRELNVGIFDATVSLLWNKRIKCNFELFPNDILHLLTKMSWGFPAFQIDDVVKVTQTKVHLVLHICVIQGFVSDGLYRMDKVMYFYIQW